MDKPKIVFLCHVSNPEVRDHLDLNNYSFRRFVYNLRGGKTLYEDFAIWVTDYIDEFEKHKEFEFHIVAPHWGMKRIRQNYERNGIHYHFFKCNKGLIYTLLDKMFHVEERNKHSENRKKIASIIGEINPDMVIMCGAENPYYALGVLDIKDKPVCVILQTLLNDPKRIEAGLATPYKRRMELEIFRHAHYFCTTGEKDVNKIKEVNPNAVILPVRFPSHRPAVKIPEKKEYDFVFFAMHIAVNKGIEDVLKALALVKREKKDVSLNIIGKYPQDYKKVLDKMIVELKIEENVHFSGFYQKIQETYDNVVKSKAAVVPGITTINSTVRESMYMGMPTIVYDLPGIKLINEDKTCVLSAPVGNVESLAIQMLSVLESPEYAKQVADNGKEYAERVFSNTAIVNKLLDYCQQIITKVV